MGMQRLHKHEFGSSFYMITDIKPLVRQCVNPNAKLPLRVERWNLRLQPYNFKIHYKPGINNPADCGSRHPSNIATHENERWQRLAEEHANLLTTSAAPRAMSLDDITYDISHDQKMQKLAKIIHLNRWI
jgi:hypothetical protein